MTYEKRNNRHFITAYDTFIRLTFSPNIIKATTSPHLIYFKIYIEYEEHSDDGFNVIECINSQYEMYDAVTFNQVLRSLKKTLKAMHKEEHYIDKLLSAVSLINISYNSLFEIGL